MRDSDPHGQRLPIQLDSTSRGAHDVPWVTDSIWVKHDTAGDRVAQQRLACLKQPEPHFRTHGPRTREVFLRVFDPAG